LQSNVFLYVADKLASSVAKQIFAILRRLDVCHKRIFSVGGLSDKVGPPLQLKFCAESVILGVLSLAEDKSI
jgi:hypothetical protein